MRSIPAAMTWELLKRSRWQLFFALSSVIGFPALVLLAIRHSGKLPADDPSMLTMNFQVMLVGAMAFGTALMFAQSRVTHLHVYPMTTSTLVAWRLIPGMVLMALLMIVSILALNIIVDLRWPIWGPALVTATALALLQAAAWLTEKSVGWMVIVMAAIGVTVGTWFKSRYGPISSDPTHLWTNVTPGEVLTMLAATGVAYALGVFAVGRNRCGRPPLSIGFCDWVERAFWLLQKPTPALRTPLEAQLWFEWKRKGWVLPLTVFGLVSCGFVAWYFSDDRRAASLVEGLFASGGLMWVLGLLGGLVLGNTGAHDAGFAMTQFNATRPLSDADMGCIMLRTAAKSVVMSWLIWAAALAMTCLVILLNSPPHTLKPSSGVWWFLPLTLAGYWASTGVLMSIGLLGRSRLFIQVACGVPASIFAFAIACSALFRPEVAAMAAQTAIYALSFGTIAAVAWVFAEARRRRLVATTTIGVAAASWLAATTVSLFQLPLTSGLRPWLAWLLLSALFALVVAPLAATPLAIAWNRHR